MAADFGPVVVGVGFVLLCGVGTALCLVVFQLRWPRSERRRRQSLSEESEVFRLVADRIRAPGMLPTPSPHRGSTPSDDVGR